LGYVAARQPQLGGKIAGGRVAALQRLAKQPAGTFQALALLVYPQRLFEALVLKQPPDRDGFEFLVIVIRRDALDDTEKLGSGEHRHTGDSLPLLLGDGLNIFDDFKKGSAFGHLAQGSAERAGFAHVAAPVRAREPRALPAFAVPRLAFGR